jgi:Fe-Mn family superoxide dismutase
MKRDAVPATSVGPFTLMPLPLADDALVPIISARTLQFHHGKHHKGYVDKLNELITRTEMEDLSLVELIKRTHGDREYTELFNNAAQVWNHDFYWHSLSSYASSPFSKPSGDLAQLIEQSFGNLEGLKARMVKEAVAQFGSGWIWLVFEAGSLEVKKTGNAEPPFVDDCIPLLTVDVWEHAYYLDYQNQREAHVTAVVDKLLNWKFGADNLIYAKNLPHIDERRFSSTRR